MVETVEHDPLTAAFSHLRDEVRLEVVAPGPDAARRTLRRRRARRTALTALTVVLAAVGVVGGLTGGPPPVGAGVHGPLGDAERLLALDAIGYPADPHVPWVFAAAMVGPLSHTFGDLATPYPPGDYTLTVACVGSGRVLVTWAAPGTGGNIDRACDARLSRQHLTLGGGGAIVIWARPDDAADGSALAVELTDPDLVTAANAVGPIGKGDLLASGQVFVDHVARGDSDEEPLAPGRYRLYVACVGQGTVAVSLTVGSVTTAREIRCTRPDPALATVDVTVVAPADRLEIRLDPRTTTPYTAVAYRLTGPPGLR